MIRVLLEKGYRVRGTVRNSEDETVQRKYPYLLELPGASERLEFVEADLMKDDGWKAAVDGCEYILHLASPYTLTYDDPQTDLVDPAVNGVLKVFQAAYESGDVKKIVQTSSMAAVSDSFEPNKVYDESDFNETSTLDRNPYYYSKVLAEKAAYKFVEDHSGNGEEEENKEENSNNGTSCFSLATICPFMVLGPSLSGKTHESANSLFLKALNGEMPGLVNLAWGVTDVRDLALAHVMLMESQEAEGRYLFCQGPYTAEFIYDIVSETMPDYQVRLPKSHLPDWLVYLAAYAEKKSVRDYLFTNLSRPPHFTTEKFQSTFPEFAFTAIETTVEDQARDMVENYDVIKPLTSSTGSGCVVS